MKAQIFNWHGWTSETDPKKHYKEMKKGLIDSGFKILSEVEHHFQPYGYTALFLLSESHFAIHTFPEEGKSYLELSSCVEGQYKKMQKKLKKSKKMLANYTFIC